MTADRTSSVNRWTMFASVGALGLVVQLASLGALTWIARWGYLPATVAAVEIAVIHNFLWHERWTWRDRTVTGFSAFSELARFGRFNVTTGVVSIAGNAALMGIYAGTFGLPPIVANVIAVGTLSIVNFAVTDRWVFKKVRVKPDATYVRAASRTAIVVGILMVVPVRAWAQPKPETLDAWNHYVAETEARLNRTRGLSTSARGSDVTGPWGEIVDVPSGSLHHWRGTVFIAGITLDRLLDDLLHPGRRPPQEDVLASRVLSRGDDSFRVYLKLVRRTIVTVTYDTEHEMTFHRWTPALATGRSVATSIRESDGDDRGFLWRLNSYWRYRAVDGGVLVELESLTLGRDIPSLVRPIAAPIIRHIARESMGRTLEHLRRSFDPSG